MRDLYGESEDDAGGYDHLRLELRALVCRAPGAVVVARSGEFATACLAVFARSCPRPSRPMRTLYMMCVTLLYTNVRFCLPE